MHYDDYDNRIMFIMSFDYILLYFISSIVLILLNKLKLKSILIPALLFNVFFC